MANQANQQERFRSSYQQQAIFPRNLIYKGTYKVALEQASERLDAADNKLFVKVDKEVILPFRDFESTGAVIRYKVLDDATLKAHLGDGSSLDPLDPTRLVGDIVTKRDPQCRFVFCSGEHSRKPLLVTARMFRRLMTYHQVMSAYVDLVTTFGAHEKARNLRFGRFSEQTSITPSINAPALDVAGRSGRFYQMCYNLKAPSIGVATTDLPQWYIRQAAVYHYFDVVNGRSCWIMTKGDWLLKDRVQDLTSPQAVREVNGFQTPLACFRTSLMVHSMICHWSTEGWRDYLERFEDMIDDGTDKAIQKKLSDSDSKDLFELEDVQVVQGCQDDMNQAAMVIKLNIRIIEAIREYYQRLITDQHFPLDRVQCTEHVRVFTKQLDEMKYDLESHVSRAELLVQIVADRKAMIVQHLQAQTTKKMEKLTESMHQIGIISQTEAIAMRVITVVTLLYLPATFVSTFFSTDVVHYGGGSDGGSTGGDSNETTSFSLVALERWIEVALPLTLLTLLFAYYFFRRSMKNRFYSLGFMP